MAQVSDFAGITNTVGAPSFAQLAKGGNHERMPKRVLCGAGKRCVGSIATRPCQERKDGAPSVPEREGKTGPPASCQEPDSASLAGQDNCCNIPITLNDLARLFSKSAKSQRGRE